jgi:hypothetical protein
MKDLRRYARQTNTRLLVGFFLILVLVGLGMIYTIWGSSAAIAGLICIGAAMVPAVLIWLMLSIVGWIAKKANE